MSVEHRMWKDMHDQPESLAGVLAYQSGAGRGTLEGAASLLRKAKRIVVTGMGASLNAAMLLDYHLRAQGLPSGAIEASELLHFGGSFAAGSVVVLVSRSGETVEAVRLLPTLRDAGAHVIGITNVPDTSIAVGSNATILVHSGHDEAVAVQSYTGTAMVSLLLSALVAEREPWQEAMDSIEAVRAKIDECELQVRRLASVPVVYVLGRGPSVATAHEGALLFNEAARLPSVCLSVGGFRHGPVEVVSEGFHAFLLASNPVTAELDAALATNLERMGGHVETISVAPGFYAPLVEVIPLQFAAYAAAVERGLTPGRFRYVSLVTSSETEFSADATSTRG
jgi:glucosamine--fructose-6-phosphate aminotransferase (isomerizing)